MSLRLKPVVVAGLLLGTSTLLGTGALAGDFVCKLKPTKNYADTTIACYSDAGCARAANLGGEPIRDFDQESAPFALARGKISAIISDSEAMIAAAEKAGANCAKAEE